jgi:hypothetical protein
MVKHCIIKGCKPSNKNELDDELPHDNQSEPGQMLPNLDTETDIHVQSDDFVATIYDNRWFIGKIEEIDNIASQNVTEQELVTVKDCCDEHQY